MVTKDSAPASTVSVRTDDRGLTTVEYVILLVVIAIVSVKGWQTFGATVKDRLDGSQTQFETNVPHPK